MSGLTEFEKTFVIQTLEEIEMFVENLAIDKDSTEYHMFVFNMYRLQRLARGN